MTKHQTPRRTKFCGPSLWDGDDDLSICMQPINVVSVSHNRFQLCSDKIVISEGMAEC
jgi:hypothetical protein